MHIAHMMELFDITPIADFFLSPRKKNFWQVQMLNICANKSYLIEIKCESRVTLLDCTKILHVQCIQYTPDRTVYVFRCLELSATARYCMV